MRPIIVIAGAVIAAIGAILPNEKKATTPTKTTETPPSGDPPPAPLNVKTCAKCGTQPPGTVCDIADCPGKPAA